MNARGASALAACLLACAALAGCGGYELRGKVIAAEFSYVTVVDADDPRLEGPGLANTRLRVVMDPDSAGRKTLANDLSAGDGSFAIPIDEIGAGFLEYDIGVYARAPGFEPADGFIRMPPSGRRVLIMMVPGREGDFGMPGEDLMRDYERFRR